MTFRHTILLSSAALLLASCAIKDDIPYPTVEGAITAFEVEGQCSETDEGFAAADINKNDRRISVYVSDTVDLTRLRIRRMEVSNDATIIPDEEACLNASHFPTKGFTAPTSSQNTSVDFTGGAVTFRLQTYQNYDWSISVQQVFLREVEVSSQVGEAVIDPVNHTAILYVSESQDLKRISVQKFSLGGQHGIVSPDPTAVATYDFSQVQTFDVITGLGTKQSWRVFVYPTEATITTTATAFARSVSATISGDCPNGSKPLVDYRPKGETFWRTVPESQVTVATTRYTAEVTGLTPGQVYEYQVSAGNSVTEELTFTTVAAQQLENASFEEWSIVPDKNSGGNRDLYQPWAEGGESYWDTGNKGATTVGASNSTYGEEGGRRYANLQSKYIVIKFAAGNIFTGKYVETDGTNGVLAFGRPFTAFPTKMRFEYKYKTSTITRTGGDWNNAYGNYITKELYEGLKGQPDSCNIYIALGDWEPTTYKGVECPYLIRTRPSELHLMDMKSPNLIAFAQLTKGEDVDTWTTETLTLNYRVRDRQPKYIIVVASSSKYGDYFTGGESSLLQVDNIELLYE